MRKANHKDIIRKVAKIIFVFFLLICIYLSYSILPYMNLYETKVDLRNSYVTGNMIIIILLASIGLVFLHSYIKDLHRRDNLCISENMMIIDKNDGRRFFTTSNLSDSNCLFFAIIFFSFLITYLIYYPGCAMNDTIQGMMFPWTSLQPPIYNMYIYYFMKIMTEITGEAVVAFSLFVVIQIFLFSISLTYAYSWLYQYCGNRRRSVLFFMPVLLPIISRYAITMVKDVPFSFCMLLFIISIFDIVNGNITNNSLALFFVSSFGLWIFRANGKYIVIVMYIIIGMVCTKSKKIKIKMLIVMILLVIMTGWVSYNNRVLHDCIDTSFMESTGIIISQIGAVFATDGKISNEDVYFFNQILPIELWKQEYLRANVDLIKFNRNFSIQFLNEHKMEFISAYLRILKNNPQTCINAYLNHTFGLWSMCYTTPLYGSQSIFSKIANNVSGDSWWGQYIDSINLKNIQVLPDNIYIELNGIYDYITEPLMRLLRLINVCFHFYSIYWIISLKDKRKYLGSSIIVLLPIYILTLTNFIAIPASFIFRYQLPISVVVPIYTLFMGKSYQNVEKHYENSSIDSMF